ncbi:MAG: hypothetical protein AB7I04_03220 [Pseudomonadales bacterium]
MKRLLALSALLMSTVAFAEEAAESPRGVIRLDETVISGNQELPKVLYILPWRDPSGLPEIELDARYSELDVFRRLYPPAYRRELTYFESLDAAKSSLGTTAKSSLDTTAKLSEE